MKKHITRSFLILLAGIMLATGSFQSAKAQDVMVSYQTFYDNLAPYGQWIYDPQYGNVWVPNEDGDFRPYGSRGYWVMTEYGNTWVSDDPWGWAVYHYGRWTYNPYYGWVWVPGYEWAPAWVSWRYGGGYAGWAPLGPGVSVGVSYYAPDSWWVFVNPTYMYQPNCIRYWNGPSYNTTYIRQTTIINNYYVDNSTRVRYNYGPRAEVIQRDTRRPVQVYRVSQLNRPGAPSVGRGSVSMYRPSVNRATVNEARPQRVMQAPQSIGRGQQVQQGNRQPEFRQEMQRSQQDGSGRGRDNDRMDRNDRQPGRIENRNDDNRGDSRPQPGRFDTHNDNNGGRGRANDDDIYGGREQMQQQRDQQVRDQRMQQQRDQQVRDQRMQQQRDQQMQQQRDQQVRDQRMQQQRDQQMQQQRDQQVRDHRMQQQRDQQIQQQRDQQVRDQRMQQQRDQQAQQQRDQRMQQQRDQQAQQQRDQSREQRVQPQQPQQPQPQQGGRGGRR